MWVCLIVNDLSGERLWAQVKELFGVHCGTIVEVPDDSIPNERYIFVQCRDGLPVLNVERFPAIKGVLPSPDNPSILSDEEVQDFIGSCCHVDQDAPLYGDMVVVLEGSLVGLFGIVTKVDGGKARVFFRLFSREFDRWMDIEHLEIRDNFFRHFRFPLLDRDGKEDVCRLSPLEVR